MSLGTLDQNSQSIDIFINEVGPRDGLQNQSTLLTPEQRLTLINALRDAGIKSIEVGSFVSPKAVPAMAGTDHVLQGLRQETADYSVLIPNRRGYDLAIASGARHVALVIAASEEMNQKNINMSTTQVMATCADVIRQSCDDDIRVSVYIATAWQCPFAGAIEPQTVADLVAELLDLGASEIVLADSIGQADPWSVKSLLLQLTNAHNADIFSCHFHDTCALGLANIYAAIEAGVRKFDAAIGGLGGCPFAPGASGNVATEDVVLMLEKMGFNTAIDLPKLVAASDVAGQLTGSNTGGHSMPWLRSQMAKKRV